MSIGVVDLDFTDAAIPKDESAVTSPEFACEVCGKELVYAGRGRKPKFCEAHRKNGSSKGTRKSLGSNAQLAGQATEALVQTNGLIAMIMMWAQMPYTAEAIRDAEEVFREQTYNALLTDPALCKTILKAGTTSGKLSLLIAYGMLAGAVGPVAYMEYRTNKEARQLKAETEDTVSANAN